MESNRLIAEFMGIKNTNGLVFQDANTKEFHSIKYHTSWDWLMPVIQKCRLNSRCEHNEDENWDSIYYSLEECDINVTYKAVVDFIKNQKSERGFAKGGEIKGRYEVRVDGVPSHAAYDDLGEAYDDFINTRSLYTYESDVMIIDTKYDDTIEYYDAQEDIEQSDEGFKMSFADYKY